MPATFKRLVILLRSLLVGLVVFCGHSCALLPPAAISAAGPGSGVSFLALGDSYTIGEGVAKSARWPVQLAALARRQGLPVQEPTIIARTGWTTAELQAAIAKARPVSNYGLVSLLIGVNNQCRAQGVARYRPEFRALLHRAIGLAWRAAGPGGWCCPFPIGGRRPSADGGPATWPRPQPKSTSSTPWPGSSAARPA